MHIQRILSIQESGFYEYWLQDQIYENPACIGLGDLEPVAKERQQSSSGHLDILLKNPEDDTMYEVEVILAVIEIMEKRMGQLTNGWSRHPLGFACEGATHPGR